ncbi:MAG: tetratricopeptide repeat protein [Gilvibacter sp.]
MKNFLLAFLFITMGALAQSPVIDSLQKAYDLSANNGQKAILALQIAQQYERLDITKGKQFAFEALSLSPGDSLRTEVHNQLGRFYFFTAKLDSAEYHFKQTQMLLDSMQEFDRMAMVNISLGAILLRKGEYRATIETLTSAAAHFESTRDDLNAAKCYSNIASAFAELDEYPKAIEYSEKALAIFNSENQVQYQMITLPNLATQYFKLGDTLKAIAYNNDAERLALEVGDTRSLSLIYNNLGSLYLDKDPAKAREYLEKTLALKKELNFLSGIEIAQSNLGYLLLNQGNYVGAISYLEEALPKVQGVQKVLVYNNLVKAHQGAGNLKRALDYSEAAKVLNDSILDVDNQKAIFDIQAQYETEKKENQILQLTNDNLQANFKRKQNRNLLLGALGALMLTLILAYSAIKNVKRKRIIAQQQLTIKNQEFDQLVTEQELNGIDAILDAQEKERNKMAADLHDNLGSKIATLKLYLEGHSTADNSGEFYNKLNALTEETYSEVRKMSQNKNFGAYINKGLVPSTKKIAEQISSSNKIDIKVLEIDLSTRIENTIEIQLFRIIQELLTNIIKHANATEATIQFTQHENTLNLIVEDNGRGFDVTKVYDGLGLQNIKKRTNRINASLVIDSKPSHGTTIIIDTPI